MLFRSRHLEDQLEDHRTEQRQVKERLEAAYAPKLFQQLERCRDPAVHMGEFRHQVAKRSRGRLQPWKGRDDMENVWID